MPVQLYIWILIFSISSGLPVFAQEQSIKVMSYNIRYDNPNDGINAWPNRKNHVADIIGKKYAVDFAGLQEAEKHQIDDLIDRLPNYSWVGVGRDDGWKEGEFSPIFYRKNRFQLLQTNTFWLSETPEIPGSKSWDTSITRIVTWGKFKTKSDNQTFYVFNTHFDHRGRKAREESAKIIWKKAREIAQEHPTILTGDFNTREDSMPYKILTGDKSTSNFSDARYLSMNAHQGPTTTSSSYFGWTKVGKPETKIDYIFVRNSITVMNHEVLTDRYTERYPSDHLPVLASIILPK